MPHLKTLVERHENDPFALIGINTGDEPDAYHDGVKEFGLTWLSAYQGMAMTPELLGVHVIGRRRRALVVGGIPTGWEISHRCDALSHCDLRRHGFEMPAAARSTVDRG